MVSTRSLLQLVSEMHKQPGCVSADAILQRLQQQGEGLDLFQLQFLLERLETRGYVELSLATRMRGFPMLVSQITAAGDRRLQKHELPSASRR